MTATATNLDFLIVEVSPQVKTIRDIEKGIQNIKTTSPELKKYLLGEGSCDSHPIDLIFTEHQFTKVEMEDILRYFTSKNYKVKCLDDLCSQFNGNGNAGVIMVITRKVYLHWE